MGRCEWAKAFAGNLHQAGFYFKARFWPGVGHRASAGARQMTEDCFCLATTGMHEDQLQPVLKEVEDMTARIEKAGLEKVASIQEDLPADAVEQLTGPQRAV